MKISIDDYQNSVKALLPLAFNDTGGSRVAATVLLSAYNSHAFRVPIVDLCILDSNNYAHALNVIRGRVELGTEPHELVSEGGKQFDELWDIWKSEMYKRGDKE